jgi:hypothetical protein
VFATKASKEATLPDSHSKNGELLLTVGVGSSGCENITCLVKVTPSEFNLLISAWKQSGIYQVVFNCISYLS